MFDSASTDSAAPDAAAPDLGAPDVSTRDTGDAGVSDAALDAAAATDLAPLDTSTADAAVTDAAVTDAATDDLGGADGPLEDAAAQDVNAEDSGASDVVEDAHVDCAANPDWWDCDWAYRRQVSFGWLEDWSGQATASVSHFAALIYLDSSTLGFDASAPLSRLTRDALRLIDPTGDGTPLPIEVELWEDADPFRRVIWVQLPVLDPDGSPLWMYYGNPLVSAEESQALWDDKRGTWHMQPAGGQLPSSAASIWPITPGSALSLPGAIGDALYVHGTQPYADAGSGKTLGSTLSVSFWLLPSATTGKVLEVAPSSVLGGGWRFEYDSASTSLTFSATALAGSETVTASLGSAAEWRHVALLRDAGLGELRVFIDGVEAASADPCPSAESFCDLVNEGSFVFGAPSDHDLTGPFFFDELRVEQQPPPPDELLADYHAARDPGSAAAIGPEQTP